MIVQDGVVLHASPQLLGALSAKTGKLLWVQPKKYIGHLWYEWKDVFVIEGLVWTWSAELVKGNIDVGGGKQQRQQWPKSIQGYDLHSGELKKEVPLGNIFRTHHHHRCYRNKATTRYVLASRRGTEYVDLLKGQHTVDNWVRGTCHVGMMPANGLQYVPPHPCQCYIEEKLVGFNALASRMAEPGKLLTDDQRFLVGPVHSKRSEEALHESAADSEQWPTFRHDGARTGSVSTKVPDDHRVLWVAHLGGNLTAPTVAGGHMFVCQQDQHNLVCLAAEDGRHEWDFAAGARIDSPPTYHHGRVLFGSRDGWVYCLDADSGELQWCYHVAPRQRWIGAFGQLESAWPVHGSLLVQNNVVYAVAGRSSQLDDGLFLVGLDVSSGELLYENHLQGPFYQVDELEQNYRLPMGALPDILVGDGERVFMRSRSFDNELQAAVAKPALQVPGGLLEDSYFKRTPWRSASGDYGRVAVRDKRSTYFVRQFDSLEGLNPSVFFTPGQQGYLLYTSNHHPESRSWRTRIPVRIRAMVLANDRLFVAGPPDVVEPDDPLGAFEGRKGGVLTVFNAQTGEQVMTHALTSAPVFNGAAAACERLYIVDDRGPLPVSVPRDFGLPDHTSAWLRCTNCKTYQGVARQAIPTLHQSASASNSSILLA